MKIDDFVRAILLFLILLIFCGLLCVFVSFFAINRRRKDDSFGVEKHHYYQYLVVNNHLNSTTRGLVSSQEEINEDFMFYTHGKEGEINVLLSKFGSQQYRCRASCTCDYGYRRASASMSRALYYLLSAFSFYGALELAKEYFSNECKSLLAEDSCPSDSVHSVVDECVKVSDAGDLDDEVSGDTSPDEHGTTEFECTGICHPIDLFTRFGGKIDWKDPELNLVNPEIKELLHHVVQFSMMKIIKKMQVYCKKLGISTIVKVDRVGGFDSQEEMAMNRFWMIHLFKYCKTASMKTIQELFEIEKEHKLEEIGAEEPLNEVDRVVLKNMMVNDGNLDSMSFCKGKKADRRENTLLVTCRRIFTDEEWDKGIPYEHNNLRHWKDDYKKEIDETVRNEDFD